MEEAIDENELRLVIRDKPHITNESRLENGNVLVPSVGHFLPWKMSFVGTLNS